MGTKSESSHNLCEWRLEIRNIIFFPKQFVHSKFIVCTVNTKSLVRCYVLCGHTINGWFNVESLNNSVNNKTMHFRRVVSRISYIVYVISYVLLHTVHCTYKKENKICTMMNLSWQSCTPWVLKYMFFLSIQQQKKIRRNFTLFRFRYSNDFACLIWSSIM